MEPSVATLIERLQRDDRAALNELFDRYYDALCRFAAAYVPLQEAEELVADVFLALWRGRSILVIRSSLRAYLYASVRYGCYRAITTRRLITLNLDDLEEVIDAVSAHGPEESMIFQETAAWVSASVQQLPSRCRQIFMMNRFDGLTYREIADVLGVAEKTVENQMVKALQVMRANLLSYEKA